jgi:hypothetical protein
VALGDTQKTVYQLQTQGVPQFIADTKAAARAVDELKASSKSVTFTDPANTAMLAKIQGARAEAAAAAERIALMPGGSKYRGAGATAGEAAALAPLGMGAKLATAARFAGAAGLGYTAFQQAKDAVRYANDVQAAQLQVAQAIKSTGGAAGVTAKDVFNLSSKIGNLAGVQRTQVQASESVLLGFTRIRNEGVDKIFDRTSMAVANVATRLHEDLSTAALQVGKALQNPIQGVSALRSQGVLFTNQQVDQIKVMTAAGNVVGAQKVMLRQLETQYGGSAAAAGKTLPAALVRLNQAWEDSRQKLAVQLMPSAIRFTNWLAITVPKATAIAGASIHALWGSGPGSLSGFIHGLPGGKLTGGAFDFLKQPVWDQAGQVNSALNRVTQGPNDLLGNVFGGGAQTPRVGKARGLGDDDVPARGLGSPFKSDPVKVNWQADTDPLDSRPVVLVADGKQIATVVMRSSARQAHAQGRGSAHR